MNYRRYSGYSKPKTVVKYREPQKSKKMRYVMTFLLVAGVGAFFYFKSTGKISLNS